MFDGVETKKVVPGGWLRVRYKGSHASPLGIRLTSSEVDTGLVPAFLDEGHAAIRVPNLSAGRYWVLASSGEGERRVGTILISNT